MTNVEKLVQELQGGVRRSEEVMKEFRDRAEFDAAGAFQWGDRAVEAAAKIEVYSRYLLFFDGSEENVLEEVYQDALRSVLRSSRSPARSTSPLSNLVEEGRAKAQAELVEFITARQLR